MRCIEPASRELRLEYNSLLAYIQFRISMEVYAFEAYKSLSARMCLLGLPDASRGAL